MALKALMLRKRIDLKNREMASVRDQLDALKEREDELARAIDEVQQEEEQAAVQEAVDQLIEEKENLVKSAEELDAVIKELEQQLAEAEEQQDPEAAPAPAPEAPAPEQENERSHSVMIKRDSFRATLRTRLAEMVTRDDVKDYLGKVRTAQMEKRAINNVGLTLPEVLLGLLKENVENYSKLYRHVNVRQIKGESRQVIMGTVPEAIWTDCCANLNELDLGFNDLEMDCYRVGGFFAICNANLEDSDIDLAAELIEALGQAIGLAVDKAILYGRNGATAQKMPMGIVTRLAQTEQPGTYPATARPWVDLHTTNIITIQAGTSGAALIAAIVAAFGAAKGKYSRGEKVFVMNEKTYTELMAATVQVDSNGRIVAGVSDIMPVVGGIIEVLGFLPDNVIIGGYFDLYTLAERAGAKFASSEHVRFLQDQTVYKGTARYDGAPAIAEGFVAIGLGGNTPAANAVTFAPDAANEVTAIALNTATASVAVSGQVQLRAITSPGQGTVTWTSATTGKATVDNNGVVTGVATGSSVITATCNGLTAACTVTVTA